MSIGTPWYAGGPAGVVSVLARNVACVVYSVEGQNLTADDQYLQIFDSNTIPLNGDEPLYSYLIPKRLLFSKTLPGVPYGGYGRRMKNGLVIIWSSTPETLTIASAVVGPVYSNGQDLAPGGA